MKPTNVYVDLDRNHFLLSDLDLEERRLVARLLRRARSNPDWNAFDNFWTRAVAEFYQARGLRGKAYARTVPYRIAQDLRSRIGIAAGFIRPTDVREDLQHLIRERFSTRRAFCKATGIAEKALDRFLAGREDLSLAVLNEALERIGYRLHIAPVMQQKQTG